MAVVHDNPYSPDFASCGFFFFPRSKLQLREHHFLHVIPKSQLEWFFWQWQKSVPIALNVKGAQH
jgi:hypothetical protein